MSLCVLPFPRVFPRVLPRLVNRSEVNIPSLTLIFYLDNIMLPIPLTDLSTIIFSSDTPESMIT